MSEEEIKKEVLKAVELYAEGGRNPSWGKGKSFCSMGHHVMEWKWETYYSSNSNFYDVLESTGPEEVTYTVKNIAISPTVATVHIQSSFSKLGKFNDMFSLVKDESGWKIISKVYDVIMDE